MKPRPLHPQNTVEPPDPLSLPYFDPKRAATAHTQTRNGTLESGRPPKIRQLDETFKSDQFELGCYHRVGSVAIYWKNKPGIYEGWEVVIIRPSKPHFMDPNEKGHDLIERYPNNAEWGSYGWSYTKFEDAKAKFMRLIRHRRK